MVLLTQWTVPQWAPAHKQPTANEVLVVVLLVVLLSRWAVPQWSPGNQLPMSNILGPTQPLVISAVGPPTSSQLPMSDL